MKRPIRCCIDLTANETFDRHGGIGKYARYLASALSIHPDVHSGHIELTVIESTSGPVMPIQEWNDRSITKHPLVAMNTHKRRRMLQLGGTLNSANIDLFHATQPAALPIRRSFQVISTIHDIIPLAHPSPTASAWETFKNRIRWRHRVRSADHLLTISEYTRRDMEEHLGIAPSKVRVVHHGVDFTKFSSAPDDAKLTANALNLPHDAILSVGSDHYRKNQAVLLDAWCNYATNGGQRDLIFVGRSLYQNTFTKLMNEAKRRGFAGRVHWRNNITDEELPAVYRLAGVAVAPSRYEGFGMTILEAMASGTPVIAAENGVYQEVGGEALLSFPADNADILTHALLSLDDSQTHKRARETSLAHAASFTWERCGAKTLAAYYAAAQPIS